MTDFAPLFSYEDDPANPGWKLWRLTDETRFNSLLGQLSVKIEACPERPPQAGSRGSELARVRMLPERRHSNLRDHVHGGALLGFIDIAMFAACRGFGVLSAGAAVTLDLSTQFIGGAQIGSPIEAQVELLRETGRMLFVRGIVVQGDERVAAFSGTLRKSSPPADLA